MPKVIIGFSLGLLLLVLLLPPRVQGQKAVEPELDPQELYKIIIRIDTRDLQNMGRILFDLLDSTQNQTTLERTRVLINSATVELEKDSAKLRKIFAGISYQHDSVYVELNNYLESITLLTTFFDRLVDYKSFYIRYADVNLFLLIRTKVMNAELHLLAAINALEIEQKKDLNSASIADHADSLRRQADTIERLNVKRHTEENKNFDSVIKLLQKPIQDPFLWPTLPYAASANAISVLLSRVYGLEWLHVLTSDLVIRPGITYYNQHANPNHDPTLGKNSWGASLSAGLKQGHFLLLAGLITPDFQRYSWSLDVQYGYKQISGGIGYSPLQGPGLRLAWWLHK
jgi:hypothetical protein